MFLTSFTNWLGKPYPFSNNWRDSFKGAAIAGLFVFLFIWIFKPFGAVVPPGFEFYFFISSAMYGLVTLLAALFVNGITRLFPATFTEEKWVIGKEILLNFGFIGFIGVCNLFLAYLVWGVSINPKSVLVWQGITFAVGIFPTFISVFLSQAKLSAKYATEAASIAPHPHPYKSLEEKIVLEGDNQENRMLISPHQINYIAAADNYVRVYYWEKSELRNQMLRATMKKMEDALAGHSFLFRCHRTYIVNLSLVQKVSGNAQGYRLHLEGIKETIPVSRNLNSEIKKLLLT
jgi:DNA-binding LytR/AlgR family response regulator